MTNTWTQAAPMPRPIGHIAANVLVRNGRIVVTSGVTSNSVDIPNVIEYDPLTNTWSELPPLPAARQSPVSGSFGDQLVVTCGLHNAVNRQTWVTEASGASGAWETGPALPLAAGEVASGIINGVLYVVGGDTNATMAYDLTIGGWRADLAQRPLVGDHHGAEVSDGKLYLFGGLGGGSAGQSKFTTRRQTRGRWELRRPTPLDPSQPH